MRWSVRLIGLLSVAILARLLAPEDYGIVAMAFILLALIDSFTELGTAMVVIREQDLSSADLDTAWTIRILQGFLVAAALVGLANPAAIYFNEPRLPDVIFVCALSVVLGSFENVGVTLIRKELDFAKDFRYQIVMKLVMVAMTIILALKLKNYWALVLAQPVSAVMGVFISYRFHPYRPRFSLASYRRFLGFSVNVVLSNLAMFLSNKADTFIVGGFGDAAHMGIYNVAGEFSSMPCRELTISVGRAMFPTLAKVQNDITEFQAMFFRVLGSVIVIAVPMGLGIWVVAPDLVAVVLGPKWEAAASLMRYLAIYGMISSLLDIMLGPVLIPMHQERWMTIALWTRAILLVICASIGSFGGVEGVALGATLSSVLTLAVAVWILKTALDCSYLDFVKITWRPVVAALFMTFVVRSAVSEGDADGAVLRLALSVLLGAVSYFGVLYLLWLGAGKPQGVERHVLSTFLAGR